MAQEATQQPTEFDVPMSRDELIFLMELRLSWLTYFALSICVQRLFTELGFTDVRLLNRQFLRGRTEHGGIDMTAITQTPLGPSPTIIQVKRPQTPVSRRSVDELRGTLLRCGAAYGILVTTSTFSPKAVFAAHAFRGRPIRLINGRELAALMVDNGIGIEAQVDLANGTKHPKLNAYMFERLERECERIRTEKKNQDGRAQ